MIKTLGELLLNLDLFNSKPFEYSLYDLKSLLYSSKAH